MILQWAVDIDILPIQFSTRRLVGGGHFGGSILAEFV